MFKLLGLCESEQFLSPLDSRCNVTLPGRHECDERSQSNFLRPAILSSSYVHYLYAYFCQVGLVTLEFHTAAVPLLPACDLIPSIISKGHSMDVMYCYQGQGKLFLRSSCRNMLPADLI
jgi:hypothetical protein